MTTPLWFLQEASDFLSLQRNRKKTEKRGACQRVERCFCWRSCADRSGRRCWLGWAGSMRKAALSFELRAIFFAWNGGGCDSPSPLDETPLFAVLPPLLSRNIQRHQRESMGAMRLEKMLALSWKMWYNKKLGSVVRAPFHFPRRLSGGNGELRITNCEFLI